jgi:hypothetical protein
MVMLGAMVCFVAAIAIGVVAWGPRGDRFPQRAALALFLAVWLVGSGLGVIAVGW